MKNIVFLCVFVLFFATLGFAAENFVLSGASNTVISSGTFTISTFPYETSFPVTGAKWVWNQNWLSSPANEVVVFFNRFNLPCACKTLTLYVTADNNFKAYINGNLVLSGTDWHTVYSTVIPSQFLNLGENTLEIVGANTVASPAAAIYSIVGA